jgi:UTP--glucose-1-phosphate uridylyltransferase
MVAVDFEGRLYDTGNLKGFLEATIDFAIKGRRDRPLAEEFIKDKAKSL